MKPALAIVQEEPTLSPFEEARANCEQIEEQFAALLAKKEGLELALSLARIFPRTPNQEASPEFLAKAKPFEDIVKRFPRRAENDLEDLLVAMDEMRPQLIRARERYRIGTEAEISRIAAPLVPAHRTAVRAIAAALEMLSKAVADEAEIQQQISDLAPRTRGAPYYGTRELPNMSAMLRGMLLNNPKSAASAWARAARTLLDE